MDSSEMIRQFRRNGLLFDSQQFKESWSKIQESSSLTIEEPLELDDWKYLMEILAQADVSRIEDLVLKLPYPEEEAPRCADDAYQEEESERLGEMKSAHGRIAEVETFHGPLSRRQRSIEADRGRVPEPIRLQVHQLGAVLRTGRFSALKTLRIRGSESDVVSTAGLDVAFKSGQFTNLRTLSLPPCNVSAILDALTEGGISQLSSLSIIRGTGTNRVLRRILYQKLDVILKSGFFKSLRHFDLSNGVLDGFDGWKVFNAAIKSGQLPRMTHLRIGQSNLQPVDLADLVPLLLVNSLEDLVLDGCLLTSEQVCGMVDAIMKGPRSALALKRLDLHKNLLKDTAVGALADLADSGWLPRLQELDLSENQNIHGSALVRLMETIQRRHLPSLQKLTWGINEINDEATEAISSVIERELMSPRQSKALLNKGELYTSWQLDGNQVELKTVLSNDGLKEVLGTSRQEFDDFY